jgi:hypothetical protein
MTITRVITLSLALALIIGTGFTQSFGAALIQKKAAPPPQKGCFVRSGAPTEELLAAADR